jgi:hypothetical protein
MGTDLVRVHTTTPGPEVLYVHGREAGPLEGREALNTVTVPPDPNCTTDFSYLTTDGSFDGEAYLIADQRRVEV